MRRELHVFCDASEDVFGAVAYWRTSSKSGLHHCHFLMGKCRVAPLTHLSIVRLELQAAVLDARLMVAVLEGMIQRPDDIIYWTDSMVIQQYIANESRRFETFVANRLAEIHDLTSDARWRHVPGKLNPADDYSRGIPVHALTHGHRWLAGPEFLRRDVCQWPNANGGRIAVMHRRKRKGGKCLSALPRNPIQAAQTQQGSRPGPSTRG